MHGGFICLLLPASLQAFLERLGLASGYVFGGYRKHQLFSGSSAIRSSIDCSSLRLLKCFQLTLVYCCGQSRIGSAGSNLPIESSTVSPQFIMCFDRRPDICSRVRKDEDTGGQSGVFPALWSSTILFRRTLQVGLIFFTDKLHRYCLLPFPTYAGPDEYLCCKYIGYLWLEYGSTQGRR